MKNRLSLGCLAMLPMTIFAQSQRPNLIVIMTDEHNFRTLGCYRNTLDDSSAHVWGKDVVCSTPNIDRIASMGVLATSYYATNPVSTPSRASFFTGLYPQQTGSDKNDRPLKDEIKSFGSTLQENGYVTGYAGKWHLDGVAKPGWACERKFGFGDNRYMYNRGHWKSLKIDKDGKPYVGALNAKGNYAEGVVDNVDAKAFTTDFLVDRAIEFIDTNMDKPFGYVISIPDPHGPNTVREPYASMFNDVNFHMPITASVNHAGLPAWAQSDNGADGNANVKKMAPPATNKLFRQYFGMVKCIDDNVGKLLQYLEKNNLLDNTIIVFTSDHGDMMGEHNKHNKSVPFEASAKVPFIVYYKGVIKAGSVVSCAMNNTSFSPTLFGLMGLKSNVKYDGNDYSQILKGKQKASEGDDFAISRSVDWLMGVTSKYKLIYSSAGIPVMYDLVNDPLESRNCFSDADKKDVVAQLSGRILDYIIKYKDNIENREKVIEQLHTFSRK